MKSNKSVLTSALFATTVLSCCVSVHSAPLPFGTTFTLDPGANPDATGLCTTGSCWGYEVSPNFWIWTMIAPGTDGGFIAGKDQLSGGQELAPSGTNFTPGDITAAWMFWSYGTFYADNALNVFSDTSNDGTTALNDFNMAWNGDSHALGGGTFLDYTIAQNGIDSVYSFEYRTTVTTGSFAGVNFRLIARGNILPVPATNPPVVNAASISAESGVITSWVPDFTDADFADTHSCAIVANASNGNATVNTDCTGGTYQSGDAYEGMDSFSYNVTDASGLSDTGIITVRVEQRLTNATLYVNAGGAPDASGMCTVGSCFSMEVAPDFWIWTRVYPGNDGGFVVGKNQLSGGQELAPSDTNATSGDISAAWSFFGAYGTFFADNSQNIFSAVSNGGITELVDFNVAWNGSVISMAGATAQGIIDDYTITLDGYGGGSWSMDYRAVVPDGAFIGIPFRMVARGDVLSNICSLCLPPAVNDINITGESGSLISWAPDFTDEAGDTHTCTITNAANGYAAVNQDCTGGTYISGAGFVGTDVFSYSVTDQSGLSATGTVTVAIEPCGQATACMPVCQDDFPVKQISAEGGGQSPVVNAAVTTVFTGHITTDSGLMTGGKNVVKICPASTVDFTSTSSTGFASCQVNGAVAGSSGTLTVGDKLICSNKPDGSDVDRFTVKSGI